MAAAAADHPLILGAAADRRRLAEIHAALGIDEAMLLGRRLVVHGEARRLTPVGIGTDGRDKTLAPSAARAWAAMRRAAAAEGIDLRLVSAFRSYEYQAALIRRRLDGGEDLDAILRLLAPPGCSEHHTGRAVDLCAAGCNTLDERFESSDAFAWLSREAQRYDFVLSYPRGNAQGFIYEPWHWAYRGGAALRR